jgi:hypothetical protein
MNLPENQTSFTLPYPSLGFLLRQDLLHKSYLPLVNLPLKRSANPFHLLSPPTGKVLQMQKIPISLDFAQHRFRK